jgi:arylsulfatase A-like enzyme
MKRKPNIVVITTHDSGCHFGCYGVPTVQTPNIDGLAADGVRLTQMFATSSICSPSRASLLSGQWPQQNGVVGLASEPYNWDFVDPCRHLSHVLRDAGYRTAMFGMHHDMLDGTRMGFDLHDPGAPSAGEGSPQFAIRTAETFRNFLAQGGAGDPQPFYAQIGFFETHTPFNHGGVAPDDSQGVWIPPYVDEPAGKHLFKRHSGQPVDPFDPDSLHRFVAALQGSVRCADEGVGIVLQALKKHGLESDTLVLFNTDHGVELPRAKWTMYDAGIRVAFIVRWPAGGVSGGRVCSGLQSNIDFLPTLVELTGLPVRHALDGVSFAAGLRGEPAPQSGRDAIFALFANEELYAARTDRYKLIRFFQEGFEFNAEGQGMLRRPVQLYDLANDPLELKDVSADPAYAAALADMNRRLWTWMEELDDPVLRGPIPTPFYRKAIADYHRFVSRRQTSTE